MVAYLHTHRPPTIHRSPRWDDLKMIIVVIPSGNYRYITNLKHSVKNSSINDVICVVGVHRLKKITSISLNIEYFFSQCNGETEQKYNILKV